MLRPGTYFEAVARGIGLWPRDFWVMLHAYLDESGTHGNSNIFVVAGLVSTVAQWDLLDKAGRSFLFRIRIREKTGQF